MVLVGVKRIVVGLMAVTNFLTLGMFLNVMKIILGLCCDGVEDYRK
jgi:hypothetical protein